MTVEQDPVVDAWLGGLNLAPRTIDAYKYDLRAFTNWCADRDVTVHEVTQDDLARYFLFLDQLPVSKRTVIRRRGTVGLLYSWLHAQGRIDSNPARHFAAPAGRSANFVTSISVADLRALIAAATEPSDRSLVLLAVVMGLPPREMEVALVTHLVEDQGRWCLRIPSRRVVLPLPDLVAEPVLAMVGDRKRGPLVMNAWGNAMTRANQARVYRRCGLAANLGVDVNPQILQASLRDALVSNPVPFAAIVQGLGANRHLNERAAQLPEVKPHFAYRAAALLRPDAGSTDALLDAADGLGGDDRLPLALRVVVAGSAFERHLRLLAVARQAVDSNVVKTTITQLAGALCGKHVLTNQEVQACAAVAEARDWAAHGWYERITEEVADRALATMRRISRAHPLAP